MTPEAFTILAQEARETLPHGSVSWDGSPYAWMRHMGPVSKSALGREIVRLWFDDMRWPYEIGPGGTDGYHFRAGGKNVAVHFATLGKEGQFRFSALRASGMGVDIMLLLGVEPSRVRIWHVTTESVESAELSSFKGDIEGLFTLTFDPDDVPQWVNDGLMEDIT